MTLKSSLRPHRNAIIVLRMLLLIGASWLSSATVHGAIKPGTTLNAGIVDIAAGGGGAVALSSDGTVWVTGRNNSGQLADGTTTSRNDFQPVATDVVRVRGGFAATLFIKKDRTLWFAGYNQGGAVAADFTDYPNAVQIATDVIDVAAAQNHSLMLKSDGSLWVVGSNFEGQNGSGVLYSRALVPFKLTENVRAIAAADTFSLFVKADGTLWGMGSDSFGQLGGGSPSTVLLPRQIATSVTDVSAAFLTTVFVKNDGSVWGLGYNASGQLTGAGAAGGNFVPVPMATNASKAVTSGGHTMILKTDGSVWSAGSNSSGQIGNGSFSQVNTPVQVLTSVMKIAAGGEMSLFLRSDGSLWAAGYNLNGQLGDGSNSNRSSPVQVLAANLSPPSAPANVALDTGSAGLVRLSSDAVVGASRYEFWRATANDSMDAIKVGDAEVPLFFDTTAIAGTAYFYWVKAGNSAGVSALVGGNSATPTASAPQVLAAPTNAHAGVGATATFSIEVSGNPPPSFQWQMRLPGGEWTNLTDGPGVTGATAATLQLSVADLSRHNAEVRGVVTNGSGSVASPAATLRVTVAAAQIADGSIHSLLVRQDGSLWATGGNPYGEHGGTNTISTSSFVWISEPVARVYARVNSSLFLRPDATLWSSGQDFTGYLGGATPGLSSGTRMLTQLTANVAGAALGSLYSLTLSRDGQLSARGNNGYGQFGDGTTTDSTVPVVVANDVVAFAAGQFHTLFVKADGSLWATGRNNEGQLGDGTRTDRNVPVLVARDVVSVAAGTDASFFIKRNGELWGMGNNSGGQLGLGSGTGNERRTTPQLLASSVTAVAASSTMTFLIKSDGTLWRTGAYTNASNNSSYDYSFVQIDASVVSVTAGESFAHWIKTDGSVWAYQANNYGQLGDGTTTRRAAPVQVVSGSAVAPSAPASLTASAATPGRVALQWDPVAGAAWYTVLRSTTNDPDTAVVIADRWPSAMYLDAEALAGTPHYFWVRSVSAGGSARSPSVSATPGAGLASVVQPPLDVVAQVGNSATFDAAAVANSNLSYRWQYRAASSADWVNLSDDTRISGATTASLTWSNLTLAENRVRVRLALTTNAGTVYSSEATIRLKLSAVAIAAGDGHSLVLQADGSLWVTGANTYGRLADGSTTSVTSPKFARDGVMAVSAGSNRTFFIDAAGDLWGVGLNNYGALGIGNTSPQTVPVKIASGVSQASAGSVFVSRDGTLRGMGYNGNGQLGNGTTTDSSLPVQIATGVMQASAGGTHTLFVRHDRTLWAVGGNSAGQLGNGTTTSRTIPVQITTGVIAASAGSTHSLFLKDDGFLWAMGANEAGQLGDGTTANRSTPVPIATDVISFAAGGVSSHFVKSDGTVWSVGSGPLGNNLPFVQQNSPVQVATNGAAVAVQYGHLVILKRDGSVWATGGNSSGQLGDGTTTTRNAPVQMWAGAATPLAAPQDLTMGAASTAWVTLTWAPMVAAGFEVWRSTDANFANATRLSGRWNGSHFIDATATPGVPYSYWVRSVAPDQSVATSAPVTAYIGITPAVTVLPASATVSAGGRVTFEASASGYPAPTFQWRRNTSPLSNATGATLTLDPVTADSAGNYDVVVTNAVGSATSASVTLTVDPIASGFSAWLEANFTLEEIPNPAVAGATADPDNDGLPNLIEYALGTHPRTATTDSGLTVGTEGGYWTFTYRRASAASDVTFAVETATNLSDWTTAGVVEELVSSETSHTVWRARVAQSGNPNCFFRLKVALPND